MDLFDVLDDDDACSTALGRRDESARHPPNEPREVFKMCILIYLGVKGPQNLTRARALKLGTARMAILLSDVGIGFTKSALILMNSFCT